MSHTTKVARNLILLPSILIISVFLFLIVAGGAFAQTFKISAYYSPIPGQQAYVSGSYEADLRMNGNGTHGADGTPVYVGMISAPSSYAFGTKIYIPGLGVGTVHDRGGGIYASEGYDRLDIWMGYGDEGRIRAITWGVQMVEGEIVSADTPEGFFLNTPILTSSSEISRNITPQFNASLWATHEGEEVLKVQQFLKEQGLFHGEVDGYFGIETKRAVFAFQIKHGIVKSVKDRGVGVWGPKTRAVANATQ